MPFLDQLIDAHRHGKELSLGHSGEVWFLTDAIDRYLAIRTPFEDFLEAPEVVIGLNAPRPANRRDHEGALRPAGLPRWSLEDVGVAEEGAEALRRGPRGAGRPPGRREDDPRTLPHCPKAVTDAAGDRGAVRRPLRRGAQEEATAVLGSSSAIEPR